MAKIDFSHKVVLLTGASGGIGVGIARRLSEQRARLVVSSRSAADLKKLARDSRVAFVELFFEFRNRHAGELKRFRNLHKNQFSKWTDTSDAYKLLAETPCTQGS